MVSVSKCLIIYISSVSLLNHESFNNPATKHNARRLILADINQVISPDSGSGATTFVYDGDGNRVMKVENGVTTIYVGALFEKNLTTNVATSYYLANGQLVALRQNTTVSYLHGDHLGSTSLTICGTVGVEFL